MVFLQPLIIKQITDEGMSNGDMDEIVLWTLIFFIVGIIRHIVQVLLNINFIRLNNQIQLDMKMTAFTKFIRLPITYYEKKNSNEILKMVYTDIEQIASIVNTTTLFSILCILQIGSGLVGLLLIQKELTLLIILCIPIRYLLTFILSRIKEEKFKQWMEINRTTYSWLGDQLSGIREIKLWNLLTYKLKEYKKIEEDVIYINLRNQLLNECNSLVDEVLDLILNSVLYICAGYLIVKGDFTLGSAFAFITYSSMVISPINFLMNVKYLFAEIIPSAERFFEFLDQEEDIKSTISRNEEYDKEKEIILELKNLCFSYSIENQVLKNVNLKIYRGEKIGIIGGNGSGKSTLLNLITGLIIPQSGEIFIEDRPYSQCEIENIRDKISVISQNIHLFQTTIQKNIELSECNQLQDVIEVCKKCGADSFIEKLKDTYQHIISVNGSNLSGGEIQKIAIARALLKAGDIYILDEATAGCDVDFYEIWNFILKNELHKKTVIVVTHKYEELYNVDRIFKLEFGVLKEIEEREFENEI